MTSRYSETDRDNTALLPNLSAKGPQTRANRMRENWLSTPRAITPESGIPSLSSMNTLKKGIARLAAKFHGNWKLINWRKFRSRKGAARVAFNAGLAPA